MAVNAAALPRYDDPANGVPSLVEKGPPDGAEAGSSDPSADAFACDPECSSKLRLWIGELWRLEVDAVVSVGNEDFGHRSGTQAASLWRHAGRQLREAASAAVEGTGKVDCGDAVVTPGFDLAAKNVIHTVSPMFDLKFKTASESALASAYWSCLSCLMETGGKSIALDVIHSVDKKYPIDAGTHIALRVIRRFLNVHGASVDVVVLCMPDELHRESYVNLMPVYFPRTPTEAAVVVTRQLLPHDVGDERGQTILRDRESSLFTSILSVPVAEREGNSLMDESFIDDMSEAFGGDFMKMKDQEESAEDHKRAIRRAEEVGRQREQEKHYESLLEQSKIQSQITSDLRRLNALYKSGVDRNGRTVVVCNLAPLVAAQPAHHHVLLHIADFMDELVKQKYSIVYIHTDVPSDYRPSYKWLKAVHGMLAYRYHKNIEHLFVLNGSIWLRTAIAFVIPPTRKTWGEKIHFIETLDELHTCIEPKQLMVDPALVKAPTGALGFFSRIRKTVTGK